MAHALEVRQMFLVADQVSLGEGHDDLEWKVLETPLGIRSWVSFGPL